MKARYITAISHLKITSDLGRGDKLDDETFITNNKNIITSLIDRKYVLIMGGLEWSAIRDSDTVIYSDVECDSSSAMETLNRKLFETKAFIHSMWLAFDNNIDSELGFLLYDAADGPNVSSNFIATGTSSATGETCETIIGREELRQVREIFRYLNPAHRSHSNVTKLEKSGSTRFTRAFYHVQASRCSADLGIKLLHYCTAVETLLATSQGELTHQLAERIACFLEPSGPNRIACYKQFKRIYSFRSRVAHGRAFEQKDIPQLIQLSAAADILLRRALNRFLLEQNLTVIFESSDKLDEFFENELLGGNQIATGVI